MGIYSAGAGAAFLMNQHLNNDAKVQRYTTPKYGAALHGKQHRLYICKQTLLHVDITRVSLP